jgi:hypothetical protein
MYNSDKLKMGIELNSGHQLFDKGAKISAPSVRTIMGDPSVILGPSKFGTVENFIRVKFFILRTPPQ